MGPWLDVPACLIWHNYRPLFKSKALCLARCFGLYGHFPETLDALLIYSVLQTKLQPHECQANPVPVKYIPKSLLTFYFEIGFLLSCPDWSRTYSVAFPGIELMILMPQLFKYLGL